MSASSPTLIAEWSPQWGIMLTWPHQHMDWQNLAAVEDVYLQLVAAISTYEKVLIVCYDKAHQQHIQQRIGIPHQLTQCLFVIAPSNDVWARDHGPISIKKNGNTQLLNFQFNAWGNRYPAKLDNAINHTVFKSLHQYSTQDIDFVLEGGSIEYDGNGSLLGTARCLLNKNRNPQYSRTQITEKLKTNLGVQQITLLQHGALLGDDTDAHIDTLARFCNERTLMYAHCEKNDVDHFYELQKMQEELKHLKNIHGQAYQLIPIPLPAAIYHQGQRLPATYLNFLIINQAVLLPIYQDDKDNEVISIFESVFKEHKIIPINCLPIIQQYGSLHCLTMQLAE